MTQRMGPDPVALKELRGVSRKWQTYVGRTLFVGITAYLLYQYWKDSWFHRSQMTTAISVSEIAVLGREIFVRCEAVSIVLTVLAGIIGASDMLAREIRNGTLGILLLTPLTPLNIVLGKFKGAMMIALSLYLCSVPVLAIAVYLGGVGYVDMIRSASFTLGLAAVGVTVSLFYSARLKSAGAAVAASIGTLLVYVLLFVIADYLGWMFYANFYGAAQLVHKGGIATTTLATLLVVIYLGKTLRQVREKTGMIPGPAELAREQRSLKLEDLRDRRTTPQRRVLRTWRVVWEENPLLWKEFTLRPALRIREDWRMRCYVILFTFFFVSWIFFSRSTAFFNLWATFFTAVALTSGSVLFAPEKEGRQWLLLLSTPISASQIVQAKLLCGLIFPEALGIVLLYLLALAAWLPFQCFTVIAGASAVATLFIIFCYALAAAASLRARTARSAFIFSAGIAAFLLAVPPVLCAAVRPLRLLPGSIWSETWAWVEALDPLTVLAAFDLEYRHPVEIPPRALEKMLQFFTLYLPATLLIPVEMIWRFRRIAIRA